MTLDNWIVKPESKTLEFKRDLSSPMPVLKTIVAFSNTSGGTIIVGVEDESKSILGVEKPVSEEERLTNLIADNIVPKVLPNIEVVSWKDKQLLKIEVYPSPILPHYLKKQGEEKGVYIRLGSSNRQADEAMIAELRRSAQHRSYDELPMHEYGMEDIDMEEVRGVFKGKKDMGNQELKTLKIVDKQESKITPTIGGMMLFGKDFENVFPDVYVQCARFRGENRLNIVDQLNIAGNLIHVIDPMIEFIQKHSMLEGKIESIRREDRWDVPMQAIREGVINAIAHADYSMKGVVHKIGIYDDRIEIINPGLLVNGITIEDIHEGVSKIRNRVIARTFKELGFIEQWGTGFRNIKSECAQYGLKDPEIEEIGGPGVRLTIFKENQVNEHELDKRLQDVLNAVGKGGSKSIKTIADELDLTERTIRDRVKELVKLGLLAVIGTNKNDPTKKYKRV